MALHLMLLHKDVIQKHYFGSSVKLSACFMPVSLLFSPEDGGNMFHRNID
jgi:hypothetical protein